MDSDKLEVVHRIIDVLPSEWNLYRIKQIVSVKITDGPHETPQLEEDGIPFISAEAIKEEKIDFEKRRGYITRELHEVYSRKCKPQKDDIFIVKSGATTGNVAYVDRDLEFNIWSPLAVVRCDPEIAYFKFVFYQLLSDVFRKQVELSWSFGTQENIGMGVLGRIKVVVPPLPEQTRIAQYLDQSCTAIDRAIVVKTQQLEKLDQLRKSIIYKAVTKGLDDSVEMRDSGVEWIGLVPLSWEPTRIKDVAKLSPSYSDGKPSEDEVCTVVPMDSVSEEGTIQVDNTEMKINISDGLTLFENGDVIFAKITPCMENGKGAYVENIPTRYAFGSTEFHVLRSGKKIDGKFLYFYLHNSSFRDFAEENMTGAAGQKRVSSRFLKYTVIHLPELNEQKLIAEHIDSELTKLGNIRTTITNQIDVLGEYKKSLIHECVTGKRRITEDDLKDVA